MEKSAVYQYLSNFELYSIHKLIWAGRDGELETMVSFEGFDESEKPKLIQKGNVPLDIEQIGGYSSILSIQEECPDGHCAGKLCNCQKFNKY